MKQNIHPRYFPKASVRCACGATYTLPATKESIEVEMCRQCSPVFTGREDTKVVMGQVEKFLKRQQLKGGKTRSAASKIKTETPKKRAKRGKSTGE